MTGFIAITTSEWILNIKGSKKTRAVFWCKKNNFKALVKGEPFFFLQRGKFESNADRYIVGYGEYQEFHRLKYFDAWTKYGKGLGFNTRKEFEACMNSTYHGSIEDIGCILLSNIHFFDTMRSLLECDVEFSPYIVSGKKINAEECLRITSYKE